jgi:hypothetical protein
MRRVDAVGLVLLTGIVSVGALALVAARSEGGPLSFSFAAIAVAVAAVLFARVNIATMVRVLDAMRIFLPIVAFLLVTNWTGAAAGTLRFDEIGAQVIAVLLLTLAVDARFFQLGGNRDRLDVMGTCFIMVILSAGEYYALRGLFTGQPQHSEMVAGAIATGFVGVATTALAGAGRSKVGEPPIRL